MTIFEAFPEVQFYDYSKYTYSERANLPNNYHLTYSFSEDTTPEILADNLENGRNVAIVFNVCKLGNKGKCHTKCKCELPESWNGYRVISGDDSDIRFLRFMIVLKFIIVLSGRTHGNMPTLTI